MRITVAKAGLQAHLFQQRADAPEPLYPRTAQENAQRCRKRLTYGVAGIERALRILEHVLHLAPALAPVGSGEPRRGAPLPKELAFGGRIEPDEDAR
jgi:hypothetical protein